MAPEAGAGQCRLLGGGVSQHHSCSLEAAMKADLYCVPARSITIYHCARAKRAPGSVWLWGSV